MLKQAFPTTAAELQALGFPRPQSIWRFDEKGFAVRVHYEPFPVRLSPRPVASFVDPKTYCLFVIQADRFGTSRTIQAVQRDDGVSRLYLDGKRITRKRLRKRWGIKARITPILRLRRKEPR